MKSTHTYIYIYVCMYVCIYIYHVYTQTSKMNVIWPSHGKANVQGLQVSKFHENYSIAQSEMEKKNTCKHILIDEW